MQRARLAAVAAAISVGLVVLSGCGQARPGTAALVDGARITDAQVEQIIDEFVDARVALVTAQAGAGGGEAHRAGLDAEIGKGRMEVIALLVIDRVARLVAGERSVSVPSPDYEGSAAAAGVASGTRLTRLRADVATVLAALYQRLDPAVVTEQDFKSFDDQLRQVRTIRDDERAEIIAELRGSPELQRYAALNRALADAYVRYDVTVNPRYAGAGLRFGPLHLVPPAVSTVQQAAA